MNIFAALFGRKKISNEPRIADRYTVYLRNVISEVNACDSELQLAKYAKDYSGYVREAAINRCVTLASSECLSIVASRLNDWVPQIRLAARTAVLTLITFANEAHLLATLPSIIRLMEVGKGAPRNWVEEYEKNFIRLVSVDALKNALDDDDPKLRRACFYILQKYKLIDMDELVSLILAKHNDIVLATQAIGLCSTLPERIQKSLYVKATESYFGSVRTIAMQALLNSDYEIDKGNLAIDSLLDIQSSVRTIAADFLNKSGFDLRDFYTRNLAGAAHSVKQIQVSLISLANFRNPNDLALIKSFTTASQPWIRKAAFLGWLKLEANAKDLIVLDVLRDDSNVVRKFALQVVRKYGAYIPFKTVYSTLMEKQHFDLLLHFSKHNKWDWIECVGRLVMHNPPDIHFRSTLSDNLKKWIHSSGNFFETPNPAQLEFLRASSTKSVFYDLLKNDKSMCSLLDFELARNFK